MATFAQRSSSSLSNAMHYPRVPSLPNSDLWTLKSTRTTVSAAPSGPVTRRVVAVCTSRKRPTQTLAHIQASLPPPQPYQVGRSTFSTARETYSSTPIGLGHPSTSARRTAPPSSQSPAHLPRINSSTIKPRTKRFPRRELHVIEEEHLESDSPLSTHTDIPALGASTSSTSNQNTITGGRLVSPSSLKATVVSSVNALIPTPRFTSSGAPQAGPNQVQSPRVLMPATMAGSPWFQSLDGAVHSMIREVETRRAVEEATVEVEEWQYKEDILLKWKFHLGMRIRFMLGRWKIPHF